MPDQFTVIGFDFGTSWIGTAVGQTQTGTASPLQAIKVSNRKPDWDTIGKLIKTWQPTRLVVGLPKNSLDEESKITEMARRFSRQLEGRFHIKAELINEHLTTREAWQIIEQKAHKHVSKPEIDNIAAVLITETWLSEQ